MFVMRVSGEPEINMRCKTEVKDFISLKGPLCLVLSSRVYHPLPQGTYYIKTATRSILLPFHILIPLKVLVNLRCLMFSLGIPGLFGRPFLLYMAGLTDARGERLYTVQVNPRPTSVI